MSQDTSASAPGERRAVRLDARHFAVLAEPNRTIEVDDQRVQTHDDLGLPLDPQVYAKSSCSTCHGQGVVTVSRPVTVAEAYQRHGREVRARLESFIDTENAISVGEVDRKVEQTMKLIAKRSTVQSTQQCTCAERRYHQARNLVKTSG